jgi:naphthoate synthase
MEAFLAGRPPDFQKFRMRDKKALEDYVRGFEHDENTPPSMRRK